MSRSRDGGRIYTYHVNGQLITVAEPPPGFHPAKASASELARYYPPAPRTSDAAAYRLWLKAVNAPIAAPPPYLTQIAVRAGGGFGSGNAQSPIWAGYKAINGTYDAVNTAWYEPSLHPSRCSTNSVSFWAGLGGGSYGSNWIEQAGTEEGNAFDLGQNQAWIATGKGVTVPENFYAQAGNLFIVTVTYEGNGKFRFQMTAAVGSSFKNSPAYIVSTGKNYSLSTAEWIAERTQTLQGVPSNLSNFGTVNFLNANIQQPPPYAYPISDFPNDAVSMVNPNDRPNPNYYLATPSGLSNGGWNFSVTQDHCN